MLFWRLLFYPSLSCDSLLSESGVSVNNHWPAVTGSLFTCSLCKSEQSRPAGVTFPNWLREHKWFFSSEMILSLATVKFVISLLLGTWNTIGGADKLLFTGESLLQSCLSCHMEIQETCVWVCVWRFWPEWSYIFKVLTLVSPKPIFACWLWSYSTWLWSASNSRQQMGKEQDVAPGNGLLPDKVPWSAECYKPSAVLWAHTLDEWSPAGYIGGYRVKMEVFVSI